MKLRFWLSYTNNRGKSYGAGTAEGHPVHVRGHEVGVEVVPRERGGRDVLDVYTTHGSNGGMGRRTKLGSVLETEEGPEWLPEGRILDD